jgi:signal transduction histidine kinase
MERIARNATRILRGLFIFRLVVMVVGALLLVLLASFLRTPEQRGSGGPVGRFMLPSVVVMVLLFVPGLERRLGRRYLPIALTAAILALSVEYVAYYAHPGLQTILTLPSGLQLGQYWAPTEAILLLLVPCMLAGTVYGVWGAARAAALASLVHLCLGFVFWWMGLPLHGFLALLPLRVAVLWVFPLIVGYLADTWRREHLNLQQANLQLRGYAATVEQLATSRERLRLARDLHDTLAHTLAALVVQLEAVDALQETDRIAARDQLGKANRQARVGLEEARRAILDLRSSPVEELGLAGALEELAERFDERSGIQARFSLAGEPAPLPAATSNALYRIAEEALSNVERHAEASRVLLQLSFAEFEGVVLRIQDDGRGFDPGDVDPERVGLLGIYERAALIGGQATVESGLGDGAALVVQVGNP